jgi:outer membrane protein assembly factor BamB
VFVFFAGYGLLAYSADGEELWRRAMGPFTNFHGMGASPLVAADKVVMICDQDIGAYLIALNAADGSVAWKVDRPEMVHSFSTPAIYHPAQGPTEVIVPGSYQMVSYDLADGAELWRWRGLTYQVKSSPVIAGDRVYFNGWAPGGEPAVRLVLPAFDEALEKLDRDGDRHLAKDEIPQEWQPGNWDMQDLDKDGVFDAKDWQYYTQRRTSTNSTLAIRLGGRGDVTATHTIWQSQRNMPDVPGVLLYRGALYLIKTGGILTTLNPETGEVFKQGRVHDAIDGYYASPVAGDGKVYLASEKGMVSVLHAAPEWEVISTVDFAEPIYATPALSAGRVYLRTSERLYCFGER